MVSETSTAIITSATAPEGLLVQYIQAHIKQGDKAKERAELAKDKAEQHFLAAGQYLITLKLNYSHSWAEWETLLKTKVHLSTGRASELMQLADGRKDLQQIRDDKAQSMARLRAQRSSPQDGCGEEKGQPAATTRVIPLAQPAQQVPEDDFIERAKLEDARATAIADGLIAENSDLVKRLLNAIDDDFPEDLDFLFVLRRRQKETIAPPTKAENPRADVRHLTDGDGIQINAHQLVDVLTASSSNEREAAANLLINGSRRFQFDAVTAAVADLYQQLAKAGR
jgi:hypothetical protein